ncbi:hypothetical protein HPB47_011607 [Ixodes persulcatus]|uniref:Uncharacterized protein n=1 Tax=Ixodes persulcatus TaxID=34615 RepID=A0AC60NVV8_IXOPE|nr:hypothetical protein HPB47_011607 [Ixodes persulcatus]
MRHLFAAVIIGHPDRNATSQVAATRRLGSAPGIAERVGLHGDALSPLRNDPATQPPAPTSQRRPDGWVRFLAPPSESTFDSLGRLLAPPSKSTFVGEPYVELQTSAQDLSPINTARTMKGHLRQCGINDLPWVPKGADLNIIENVWGRMKAAMNLQEPPKGRVGALHMSLEAPVTCFHQVGGVGVALEHGVMVIPEFHWKL